MRVDHNILVLGIALASAMPVMIAGCVNRPDQPTTAGTEIHDTVVTTKVKSALLANPELKGFDLQVETHQGVPQLRGLVDNQAQIASAYATARGVEDVGRVDSSVRLKGASTTVGSEVSDDIITTKLMLALLADPKIKSFDITVVTHKGAVHLSGFVNNQVQIDQAIAIAHKVAGVKNVNDELSIKNSRPSMQVVRQ